MRYMNRAGIVGLVAIATMTVGGVSFAGDSIPWTWNSNDTDARARFKAYGEHYFGRDYAGKGYVDWSASGEGSGRWWIPGASGKRKDFNQSFHEGRSVSMQVCQEHSAFPDDCSRTKHGVS